MSLLVCDTSLNLLTTHVLYHSKLVDKIVCVANKPSKLLVHMLRCLERGVHNFELIDISYDTMTISLQMQICTKMTIHLKNQGCSWVIPCDDDEFYLGNIRDNINLAEINGCNVLYQDGFCFYNTDQDVEDLNPVRSMVYRDPPAVDYAFRKAIHKTQDFSKMLSGNHWVEFKIPTTSIKSIDLFIYHYHFRKRKLFSDIERPPIYLLTKEQIVEKSLIKDEALLELLDTGGIP